MSANGKYCNKWKLVPDTGSCFSIDSYLIVEGYGKKKINDVKYKEKVLSIDPKTQEPYYAEFVDYLHYFDSEEAVFNKITLENGQEIDVTDNHHVYIKDSGYIFAEYVKIGDSMLFLATTDTNSEKNLGDYKKIVNIEKVTKKGVYGPWTDRDGS